MEVNERQECKFHISFSMVGSLLYRSLDKIVLCIQQEWEEKAAAAKEQYTKDLESYNANGGGGEGGGKKPQKRGKKAKKAAAPVSISLAF